MRKILQIITVLTIVGLLSGASLVLVYRYTKPLITANQKKETEASIFKLFPQAEKYEKIKRGQEEIFLVKDKKGKKLGYTFIAKGNGYQGEIKIMVGINLNLKTLLGIEILESQETPGLGQRITSNNFRNQFKELKTLPEIIYVKGETPDQPNEIEAITGATISSRAVVTILNDKIKDIRKVFK